MKKPSSISLFWKFTIAIVTIVALFGTINLYFISYSVYDLFEKEINRHGITTAKGVAERSVDDILYKDISNLNRLVSDKMRIDSSIAYIVIVDENNNVLAHTFNDEVPQKLLSVNNQISAKESIIKISEKNAPENVIRDMAIPILQGNLGMVRVGIYEENFIKSINAINKFFLLLVLVFLTIGVIGAFIFSYIITYPLKKMSEKADNLNLNALQLSEIIVEKENTLIKILNLKNILNVEDEIDVLTNKFNEMVDRLQTTYGDLQEAQSSLIQSEKMASLGTLSAGLAHEINNPIAGIKNCMRRISEAPENIKQNIVYIEMMEEAVLKIEKVVGGLLNFTRKPKMEFAEIQLKDIIENVLLLSAFQLEKSRITLIKKYSEANPFILASSNHIEQVILNLLLNSIDSINEKKEENPDFTGEIYFNLHHNSQYVEFEISDNGIGVPKENLQTIFDPFFTMKKIRQGTGLGLSVCYNIIEQHQGKIVAKLNSKGGMKFIISLPINETSTV
ncbi:MAG: ATP-binding protein [Flavobacteriaceae bacterium]|nr:ATP-binding protein [Flavobacteriaceae bacterium]